jgi:hypothetical protein
MIENPEIGMRVKLATAYLRATMQRDRETWLLRGTITKVDFPCGGHHYLKILWDGNNTEKGCLSCNVERTDAPCLN